MVSFFLPWIGLLGVDFAGYELHKLGDDGPYWWGIPALAGLAALLGVAGKENVRVAQLVGCGPLVFFGLIYKDAGADIFKIVRFGGYIALISGIFLLAVAPFMSRKSTK